MTLPEDRPLGIALVGLGIAAGSATLSIGGWGSDAWGPRTVPLLASLTIVTAGATIALSLPAKPAPGGVGGDVPHDAEDGAPRRVAWLLCLAVVYVLAIDRVGYLIATSLATPAAFALFGVRRPPALLAAALLVPLALHLVFFRLLGVFPPLGAWFDPLDYLSL